MHVYILVNYQRCIIVIYVRFNRIFVIKMLRLRGIRLIM